ncbi:MAG: DMT family transporter [Cucumibacter sp.]
MTKAHSDAPGSPAPGPGALARPYLVLLLAPLFWSGNTIASKLAVGHIEPLTLTATRWITAFLLVLPFAWPHLRRDWKMIRPKLWLLLGYGAFGMSLFNVLLYSAPHFTSAVNMSIEQAAIPVLVMVGNFAIFRVRARLLQIVGVALTLWGVLLVATHGAPELALSLSINQGDALMLGACLAYAVYSLTLRYRPDIHWLSFLVAIFAGAALASILFQLALSGPASILDAPQTIDMQGWLIVAYTAIFASIVAQLCYAVSVSRVGPNRASLFINLIPVFGTLMSIALLGERFEPYHLIASGFVIVGIALAEWTSAGRPEITAA